MILQANVAVAERNPCHMLKTRAYLSLQEKRERDAGPLWHSGKGAPGILYNPARKKAATLQKISQNLFLHESCVIAKLLGFSGEKISGKSRRRSRTKRMDKRADVSYTF
jgi:hypothetical protein